VTLYITTGRKGKFDDRKSGWRGGGRGRGRRREVRRRKRGDDRK